MKIRGIYGRWISGVKMLRESLHIKHQDYVEMGLEDQKIDVHNSLLFPLADLDR